MPHVSFARNQRLRESYLFRDTIRTGLRSQGTYFTLHWKANEDETRVRCGLSVGRRVSRKAVTRNRLKRLLREALRQNAHRLPEPKRGYVVIVGRGAPGELTLRAVSGEVEKCLEKFQK